MNPQHPGSGHGRSYRPCLERLEDRFLPAINFAVVGNTLVVTAPTTRTPAHDNLVILDNGSQGANNVVAVATTAFYPGVTIDNVSIQLSRNNDNITYFLAGPLSGNRFVLANLSTGTDSFTALGVGGLLPRANLVFSVGGLPRRQGDHITGAFSGDVQPGSSLLWTTFGATGNNTLSFNLAGNIRAGGSVLVSQLGGLGSNEISAVYGGLLTGSLGLANLGGQGNNNVFADVELNPGSTGTLVPSMVTGGNGTDDLAFLVHDPTHAAIVYNQVLDGGGGFNVCARTSNVMSFGCSLDDVLP
jgi:hypothetical protein